MKLRGLERSECRGQRVWPQEDKVAKTGYVVGSDTYVPIIRFDNIFEHKRHLWATVAYTDETLKQRRDNIVEISFKKNQIKILKPNNTYSSIFIARLSTFMYRK